MTPPNGTKYRAVVDTHRHPVGARLRDKMAEAGLFDPRKPLPQANAQDFFASRDFLDLDYGVSQQREGGVTLSIASNGGEVDWISGLPGRRVIVLNRPGGGLSEGMDHTTIGFRSTEDPARAVG
jgi:hypothetical protein